MKSKLFPTIALVAAVGLLLGLLGFIYHTRSADALPPNVVEATVDNFEDQVLNSPVPVYIEFYVPGSACKPCQAQAPIVAKLATEYAGKVRFVRVDASKQPEIAQAAGIRGVPTHIFLKPAEGVGAVAEGFLDEAKLREFLDKGLTLQKPAAPANGGNAPADGGNAPADPAAK